MRMKIDEEEENGWWVENSITIEESRAIITEKQCMGLNDEMILLNAYRSLSMGENKENTSEMYLARGLGVERVNIGFGGGGGGGGEHKGRACGSDGGSSVEEHYKRLVENPRNTLFLRNYAQFLYESEKDMSRADKYYSRAILADPKDGEVLSQDANVVWEIHHDQDRASSYFERAVHAAAADSHVHAAYASFLWETEEGNEDANGLCFYPRISKMEPCLLQMHRYRQVLLLFHREFDRQKLQVSSYSRWFHSDVGMGFKKQKS